MHTPHSALQFVDAVNQLGVDKAVPKRILDLMNVEGLTRENVASHLQVSRGGKGAGSAAQQRKGRRRQQQGAAVGCSGSGVSNSKVWGSGRAVQCSEVQGVIL